jgi:hypothetical protein
MRTGIVRTDSIFKVDTLPWCKTVKKILKSENENLVEVIL